MTLLPKPLRTLTYAFVQSDVHHAMTAPQNGYEWYHISDLIDDITDPIALSATTKKYIIRCAQGDVLIAMELTYYFLSL